MKYIINENECAFLTKNGIFEKLLTAGKYSYSKYLGYELQIVPMIGYVKKTNIPIEVLMKHEEFSQKVIQVQIPDDCIAIHYVNHTYKAILLDREAVYWNVFEESEFELINITNPYMDSSMPKMYIEYLPARLYKKITVSDGELGLLYFDNVFEKELTSGIYYFWNTVTAISCKIFNLKTQQLDILGQEILTADKVSIRLNLVCNFRINDPISLVQKIENLSTQLHTYTQLIVREYVGRYRLDELLEQKEDISQFLFEKLLVKQKEYFVEFINCGIKDIILPGEIRDIMNTVLVAEKTAQANVITRREEVASTRSLLNTAKLMDENKTLFKLKELEYLEKICDKVGTISLSDGGNVISQLSNLVGVPRP